MVSRSPNSPARLGCRVGRTERDSPRQRRCWWVSKTRPTLQTGGNATAGIAQGRRGEASLDVRGAGRVRTSSIRHRLSDASGPEKVELGGLLMSSGSAAADTPVQVEGRLTMELQPIQESEQQVVEGGYTNRSPLSLGN